MTVLIDSWAWIDYFHDRESPARPFIEEGEGVLISSVNIAEVYRYMLKHYSKEEANKALTFMKQTSLSIPVTDDIAVKAAEIRHEKKLGLGDALVLATALTHNVKVVTGDSDFKNENNAIYLGK